MSILPNLTDSQRKWPVLAILASYVFALFATFAAVATGIEVVSQWRKEQWPSARAAIERCEVKPYIPSFGRRAVSGYYITCGIRFEAGLAQTVTTDIRSLNAPAPERAIWPDPSPRILGMRAWVDQHPPGTALLIHYDPAHPLEAVLKDTDMPYAGPQLSDDAALLLTFASICGLLHLVGRLGLRR